MPLNKLWENLKGLFTKKPDTRPDPEDKDAYEHLDKVIAKMALEAKPVQILRDKTKRPTDVTKSAADLRLDEPKAGITYWVDVYEGPRGSGYQACYEIQRGQKTFRKVINYGPEEEREQDWTEVQENVL